MKQSLNSIIYKLCLYKIFSGFLLIYPFYVVFMTDSGITNAKISFILTIWAVACFVVEIPSGILADKFSRKNILSCSGLVMAVACSVMYYLPTTLGFTAGFILWGISSAMVSGTWQALLYDSLSFYNKSEDFEKIYGRIYFFKLIANTLAIMLAGLLVRYGYKVIFLTTTVTCLVSVIIAYSLPLCVKSKYSTSMVLSKIFTEGKKEIFQNKTLLWIISFLSFYFLIEALSPHWQTLIINSDFTMSQLGFIIAIINGLSALGYLVSYKCRSLSVNRVMMFYIVNIMTLITGFCFVKSFGVLLIFAYKFNESLLASVMEGRLQNLISSDSRATISSVKGFLSEICSTVAMFSFGMSSMLGYSISQQLVLYTSIALLGTIAFYIIYKKYICYTYSNL